MRRIWIILALMLTATLHTGAAVADSPASAWDGGPESQARLISAVSAAGELQELPLGLHIRLAKGWKTYWRSPGEGGYPPRLDWTGSENLAGADLGWPAPQRFSILGIDSVGYAEEVVQPLTVRPAEPGRPVRLRLALDYLTCETICIPQTATIAVTLPSGPAEPTDLAHLIDRFRGRIPGPAGGGLSVESAAVVEDGGALRFSVLSDRPLRQPDIFVESDARLAFGAPRARSGGDGRSTILEIPVTGLGESADTLVGREITLTLVDGARALEQRVTVGRGAGTGALEFGLVAALGIALLGGLILNVMPCVLPVLSIKLLGVIGHSGSSPGQARRSFLATAAGILTSFLLLALAAIAVQAAGLAVSWGIQFQQPWFLAGMALLLLLFSANLWGWFEVRLPGWAGNLGVRDTGEGTLAGAFLTGMLATLLATPCSAPFVGTAIGFALSRGPGEIMAIFVALGLGLAVPYLVVAAAPRLATRLPKPGRWMVTLRRALGLPLIATALWLLSVLAVQAGLITAVSIGAAGALILLLLWSASGMPSPRRWGAIAALMVGAIGAPLLLQDSAPLARAADAHWQAFDQARIAELVRGGRTVLVDVTADWCITCQVNKAAVLARDPVAARLGDGSVVPMRADWTSPDAAIAAYLASFGRYGIPFNAVYGPGAPAGIALPELLTGDAVMSALERARGPRLAAPAR